MSNNDQHYFYSPFEITYDAIEKIAHKFHHRCEHPKLVLCRPVFQPEIDAGLDTNAQGDNLANYKDLPEITRAIDAYYIIKAEADFWIKNVPDRTPSEIIAHHVAYAAFDCMSGGMPLWEAIICRQLALHPSINRDELVYPGKLREGEMSEEEYEREHENPTSKSWYTLGDWLDMHKDDKFDERIREIAKSLKELPSFLALPPHEEK
jgi:hypothetical protein